MNHGFRFENLEIWKRSAEASRSLFTLADELENQKKFRFSEQLRGASLSITNNIAEGAGSYSKKEFAQYLNYARRSIFEVANILKLVFPEQCKSSYFQGIFNELVEVSSMIHAFRKTLMSSQ